jgi:hypothetical protein
VAAEVASIVVASHMTSEVGAFAFEKA